MFNTPNNNGASNGNSPATGSPSPSKQLVQIEDPTVLGQVAALLEDADDTAAVNRAVSEHGDSPSLRQAAAGPPAGNAPGLQAAPQAGDALNAQRALDFAGAGGAAANNVAPQPAQQQPPAHVQQQPQPQQQQQQQQQVVQQVAAVLPRPRSFLGMTDADQARLRLGGHAPGAGGALPAGPRVFDVTRVLNYAQLCTLLQQRGGAGVRPRELIKRCWVAAYPARDGGSLVVRVILPYGKTTVLPVLNQDVVARLIERMDQAAAVGKVVSIDYLCTSDVEVYDRGLHPHGVGIHIEEVLGEEEDREPMSLADFVNECREAFVARSGPPPASMMSFQVGDVPSTYPCRANGEHWLVTIGEGVEATLWLKPQQVMGNSAAPTRVTFARAAFTIRSWQARGPGGTVLPGAPVHWRPAINIADRFGTVTFI